MLILKRPKKDSWGALSQQFPQIVALAHNKLKVVGIRQILSEKNYKNTKASGEIRSVFLHLLYFRNYRTAPFPFYEAGSTFVAL